MWRSTPVAWINMPEITHLSWDNNGMPIWIEDAFPNDVTQLLISNETDEVDEIDDDEEEIDEDQRTMSFFNMNSLSYI